MAIAGANFSEAIPQPYERHFGPALFGPFAADVVRRLDGISSGSLLEIAAGTGIVTAAIARGVMFFPDRIQAHAPNPRVC